MLLLLFSNLGSLSGANSMTVMHIFSATDVEGLQNLWAAWNTSTPNKGSNLLNWETPAPGEIPWPCYDSKKNWRGVTCLRYQLNATQWDTWVVGLKLSDASIAGILPREIRIFNKLVTLTLTGNPSLTGSLPSEVAYLPLNVLDLHDNGFNGTIPTELSRLGNLLELDLSGNQFEGGFPSQFSTTPTLQVFKIARNLLQDEIPANAFENMTQLLILDLSGNNFTGPSPKFPVVGSKLFHLNISYNKFTGLPELSQVFNGWLPNSLGVLDLSGLNIGGRLPPDWNLSPGLLSLEKLYVNNINISGVLDIKNMQSSVQKLAPASRTLHVLSLMDNGITDVVFDKQFLTDGKIKLFLQGNPYCAEESKDADGQRCFCEQYCAISPEPSKKSYLKVILITTSICAVLLGSVIFFLFFQLRKKNQHMHTLLKRFDESDVRTKRFEYSELRTATKNFAQERKLGQGAYGAVYKGILPNNVLVAVKQLFMRTHEGSEDFLNEVLLISNLQHRNLVALKGYCLHGKEMLLVYEFVDYCDLDKLLLQRSRSELSPVVAWPARMHICLGTAQGLYYLHASSSSETKIIHRDIKASNILVDKNLNPKIADFGLARPIQDEKSGILTMQRAGTVGYLAPEYMLYGHLSDKADVFSFGVLLLEIVSGSNNKDPTQPDDEVYLPNRARKLLKEDRLIELMDSRLRVSEADALEVQRVLEIAVMCVQAAPEMRPTMFRVVAMLAGDANVVIEPMDDSDQWRKYHNFVHHQSTSENPFHSSTVAASLRTNGSSSSEPFAPVELSTLHDAR